MGATVSKAAYDQGYENSLAILFTWTDPITFSAAYSDSMAQRLDTQPLEAQTPDNRGRPTLLVFTRGAAGDREQRRLLPQKFGGIETAFHRACLDAALAAGRAAGCRLAVATGADLDLAPDVLSIPQRGTSFGERFRHAVAQAERVADGPLVIVGTDVPDLQAGHLRDAVARLRGATAPVVVGPATDGGFYLLASTTPIANLLGSVRWCRRDTLRSLLATLESAGRAIERLEPLADLDHRRALERWMAHRRRHLANGLDGPLRALVIRLRRVLATLSLPSVRRDAHRPSLLLAAPLGGRAPPRHG